MAGEPDGELGGGGEMRGSVWLGLVLGALVMDGQAWAQSTTTPGVPSDFGWKDGITLAIAVLGAALGIYNAIVAREVRKVKLKVVPGWSSAPGFTAFSIEVVNLSTFTVTVDQVGFLERGAKATLPVMSPVLSDGGDWPRKLGSREAVTMYVDANTLPVGIGLGRAFAQTVSDERATGTNAALKQLARLVKDGSLSVPRLSGRLPPVMIRSINPLPADRVGGQ